MFFVAIYRSASTISVRFELGDVFWFRESLIRSESLKEKRRVCIVQAETENKLETVCDAKIAELRKARDNKKLLSRLGF